jgi:hypothetical protein
MLEPHVESKETYKSRISFLPFDELISIEHFSQSGDLLSETRMSYEEAISYARLINDVCDEAFSVND